MANNPYVNKVQLADGTTLMDISEDTVTAGKMLSGTTAHNAAGAQVTGTLLQVGDLWTTDRNVTPHSVLGFGTWELVRKSEFTWAEAGQFTWGELAQDNWAWDGHRKIVYIWIRTA